MSAQREQAYENRCSEVANDDGDAGEESRSGALDGKLRAAIQTIELMTENLRTYLLSRR